jgi:hypothetical protein
MTTLLRLLAFVVIALLIVSGAEAQETFTFTGQWFGIEPPPFKNNVLVVDYSCELGFAWVDSYTRARVCAREMRAPR